MMQAPAAPVTTYFKKPPPAVTLEEFAATIIGPMAEPIDGAVVSAPAAAATRAAYEASVVHAKRRGTIMVACSDSGGARECLDHLRCYFTDQPQLSLLFRRSGADVIELQHGQRILVTTAPRRPRDLLATIVLTPSAPVDLPSDLFLARSLCHCLSGVYSRARQPSDADLAVARLLCPDDPAGYLDGLIERWRAADKRYWAERREEYRLQGSLDELKQYMRPTSVPCVPLEREPDVVSPEYEQRRVERVTAIKPKLQTRAIMGVRQ
jgi:hypothetical protein